MVVAETARLRLRRFEPADAPALEAIFCDPEVMRFGGVRTPGWVRDLVAETIAEHYPRWGFGRYAVIARVAGELIGQCGFLRHRWPVGEAEIVYRFVPARWGRGYATEAAAAACEHGFAALGLHRIFACIDPDNAGSIKVAKKLGMVFDRRLPSEYVPGAVEDCYAVTRERFAGGAP